MTQKILIRDLTLRDGQQSAFATRMTQAQIDRVLPFYKDANFYAMEVWGGAVPDSIMRYLNENPWARLEKIKASVGNASKLAALSRGRNLFGYSPYTDSIIDGFCKNSIESGLGIMRIFDALNDVENVKASIKYVKQYAGIADCAVCYTIDPHFSSIQRLKACLKGKPLPKAVFTNDYFLNKAKEMEALGADMITIKDMSGLVPPSKIAELIHLFKKNLKVPIDFHTHCTPGFGLAAVLQAIVAGVDIVDTAIWNFAGGPAAPAIELIYLFCLKLGVVMDVNMEAVAKINKELYLIRKELEDFDAVKQYPKKFNPLTDIVPTEINKEFDKAIEAANANQEEALLKSCHAIEAYFNFPAPNEMVKNAEIPGGMYTNMVAQLKQLNSMDILENAMKLLPTVRLAAGLPPLVTPTSQIVGAQAVNCAIDIKSGKQPYTNVSNQFAALVKGEYGKTPIPIDPQFRLKITGMKEETPYDTSTYKLQPNPELPKAGGVKLAENEKEVLLLELFPTVAKTFLTKLKEETYEATHQPEPLAAEAKVEAAPKITGKTVEAPMPGSIWKVLVKVGDTIKRDQTVLILEAMKMENNIASEYNGTVKQVFVKEGDVVPVGRVLVEISA
ncbi:putative oxaloacetate decarboxylase alpha chain [Bacteroidia bacterium]|nr:putative oxaloacetate decarboxylase alpha chain [Bacteroidia bacterium]